MQSKARDLKKESSPQREFFTEGTQGMFFVHGGWGQVFNTKVNFPILFYEIAPWLQRLFTVCYFVFCP